MIFIPEMEIRDLIFLFPKHTGKQVNKYIWRVFLPKWKKQFILCKTFDMHSALFLINSCCMHFFCYNFIQNCMVYDQGTVYGTEQERISFLIERQ